MDDQTFEVNLIENLTSEHSEEIELETECEFELEYEDFNLDQIIEFVVIESQAQFHLIRRQQT